MIITPSHKNSLLAGWCCANRITLLGYNKNGDVCRTHNRPNYGTDVHLPLIQPHYGRQKVNFPSKTAKANKVTQRKMCLKPGNNTNETDVLHFRFCPLVIYHIYNKFNPIKYIFPALLTLHNRLRVKQIYLPSACQLFHQHLCTGIQVHRLVHITVLNVCQQN
jgi:hypothetical protein